MILAINKPRGSEIVETLLTLAKRAAGIACDSRHVKPGYIFFAIKGRTQDGNDYAFDAEQRGAIAIVTDQQPPKVKIPVINTTNARQALAEAAAVFYCNPSHHLSVIGVTGTNGKTTITYMLEQIFCLSGLKTGLIGTIKVNTGRHLYPSRLTTPDAVSLQDYLHQMQKNGVTHVAMEVSAQGIEMHRVDKIAFSCGILSNITPDHFDFHGDFNSYFMAKQRFLNLLGANTPLIVNTNDPYCCAAIKEFNGRIITAAVNANAVITAKTLNLTSYNSHFQLNHGQLTTISGRTLTPASIAVRLSVPGLHNIENALLAAAAAIIHDIPVKTIATALANFRCVERRMNIFHFDGRTVIDDTALNPASIDAVMNSVNFFRNRRLFVVNAIRGRRGAAINKANAATLASWQKKLGFSLAITSSIGNVASSDIVTIEEKMAFFKALDEAEADYKYFPKLESALSNLLTDSRPGDLLVLLGAQGMDNGRRLLTAATTDINRPIAKSADENSAILPLSTML